MPQPPLTNTQKIATLLLALGAERSSEILEHLDQEQITRIAREIAGMGRVSNQAKRAVLREFRTRVSAEEQLQAGRTFAETVLERTLGTEHAQTIIGNLSDATTPTGPPLLATLSATQAATVLDGEPPHLIAMLLLTLPPARAGEILALLPSETQVAVAQRIAQTPPPGADVRAHLERALRAKAVRLLPAPLPAETIAEAPAAVADPSPPLEMLDAHDDAGAPTAPAVSFHDIGRLHPLRLQAVLHKVETADLCLALHGADRAARERVLLALPFGRRVAVQSRLKNQQGVALRAIEEAQQRIAALAAVVCAGELQHA